MQEEDGIKPTSREDEFDQDESLPFDESESEINVARFVKEDSAMN